MTFNSWGNYFHYTHEVMQPIWRDQLPQILKDRSDYLACGYGRSYGDVCLNDQHDLIQMTALNRVIHFDKQTGIIRAEAGISLAQILDVIVPHGFFLPVTPGTKFVSLAGAITNDVHGKNHHKVGCFGNHVKSFELYRSDQGAVVCTPEQNQDLFKATIGGLGLTGVITWAEIQLTKIGSSHLDIENIKHQNLDEFVELSDDSENKFDYTVSWIDCLARGSQVGKGIFMRGNFLESGPLEVPSPKLHPTLPIYFPNFALNQLTVKTFNTLYYNKQANRYKKLVQTYEPFFYPLDALHGWNKMYGKRGFIQYQYVIPSQNIGAVRESLKLIANAGLGSFLVVLKKFGSIQSPGLMSFPFEGYTLALDFPNTGQKIIKLSQALDDLVKNAQGRLYPAKDSLMSSEDFQNYYPQYLEFKKWMDPKMTSSFWRRVVS